MPAKTKVETCRHCGNPIPEIEARRIGRVGLCEPCREKHRAAWREENTRKPGDARKRWLIGDECQVRIGKVLYQAKILDMSDVSRRENDYDLVQLELTKSVAGWDSKPVTQTWIHPSPVQSYRLLKKYTK